ncbi:hypothetical protein JCM19241_1557 [Vibrio ishigakensis]|uniref:Sulfatase-modifying factor enzyme-like domain-containing protein n=1 Tax=Vibrio ishigakensis TaxID=1481914 RepID=A0A0B8QL74_9VIBR|nr:hypothetical protein JCM19241_1557 [Vibrio ishigakensis]
MRPITRLALPSILIAASLAGCASAPQHLIAQTIETDMVLVEGGSFTMGSDLPEAGPQEKPAREVSVDSFYISKFEVTQELFESVMGHSMSYFAGPDVPVNNLSWQQANYFIEKLNQLTGETYRLPTEAEWEFAAKGGNKSQGFKYSAQTISTRWRGMKTTPKIALTL